MSTFVSPTLATSGLQGYDLEGADPNTKHRKATKTEAGYVDNSPTRQCKTCTMFVKPDACTAVKGDISPYGHCNYYDWSGAPMKIAKEAPARAAGIALISRDDGKVLFLRRSEDGDDHPGEWNFPGGGIEAGETEEQAAIRELFEETAIKLDDDGSRVMVGKTINNNIEFSTFVQKVDAEIEPKLNGEHSAFRWASLDYPPDPLHPWVRAALPLVKSAAVDLTLKAAGAAHPHEETKTMENLALFVPVLKVDAEQRIVYGTAVAEVADRANEIFDYKSSKPEFEKWSSDIEKVTDGKSKGNVRAMHGKVAAGKITDIAFDDDRKAIDVAVKVVDDDEWNKVTEGVYTGFSIGGKYLKRWQDGDLKRYTAAPSELSLVDLPCVPTATFTMIKADGTEEIRKFTSIQRETEEIEKTEDKPEVTNAGDDWAQVWVSKRLPGKMFAKKAELQQALVELDAQEAAEKAAADVIAAIEGKTTDKPAEKTEAEKVAEAEAAKAAEAEKAKEAEIAKAAEAEAAAKAAEGELVKAEGESDEDFEKRKFDAKQRKKDAKNGDAEDDGSYPIENKTDLENAIRAYGRSKNKAKTKRHIISRARSLGLSAMLPADWKANKFAGGDLEKDASLYGMASLMDMLAGVERLEDRAEDNSYGFGVELPKDITDRFGLALVNLGDVVADILDAVLSDIREEERDEAVNRASEIAGLTKVDEKKETTEKAENGDIEKAENTETTADEVKALKRQNAAEKAAFEKVLAAVKDDVAKHKAETEAEVNKIRAEKDELHKQVMAIRNTPINVQGMNLRVVEKSIDSTDETEKKTDVSADDLRKAGLNAQMARIAGRR